MDVLIKFARYFRNPTIVHYVIVVPTARIVIRHKRGTDGRIESASYDSGPVLLDPPGLELDLAMLFPAAPEEDG